MKKIFVLLTAVLVLFSSFVWSAERADSSLRTQLVAGHSTAGLPIITDSCRNQQVVNIPRLPDVTNVPAIPIAIPNTVCVGSNGAVGRIWVVFNSELTGEIRQGTRMSVFLNADMDLTTGRPGNSFLAKGERFDYKVAFYLDAQRASVEDQYGDEVAIASMTSESSNTISIDIPLAVLESSGNFSLVAVVAENMNGPYIRQRLIDAGTGELEVKNAWADIRPANIKIFQGQNLEILIETGYRVSSGVNVFQTTFYLDDRVFKPELLPFSRGSGFSLYRLYGQGLPVGEHTLLVAMYSDRGLYIQEAKFKVLLGQPFGKG